MDGLHPDTGAVFVVTGSGDGLPITIDLESGAAVWLHGDAAGDLAGESVAVADWNGDGFDVIYTLEGELERSVPVGRMRPVRGADREATRRKSYGEYRNPETKLTEWDLEVGGANDLTAACACRGRHVPCPTRFRLSDARAREKATRSRLSRSSEDT